ncbi:hypothetical protein [Streptomyces tendae]|uniref:hypothetical protein n=1 Tax=Streptomyces tendae TaxID=1932 RepID=UPI00384B8692
MPSTARMSSGRIRASRRRQIFPDEESGAVRLGRPSLVKDRQPPQAQPDLGVLRDVVRRNGRLFPGVESSTAGMLTLGVPEPLVDGPPSPLLGLGAVHSW